MSVQSGRTQSLISATCPACRPLGPCGPGLAQLLKYPRSGAAGQIGRFAIEPAGAGVENNDSFLPADRPGSLQFDRGGERSAALGRKIDALELGAATGKPGHRLVSNGNRPPTGFPEDPQHQLVAERP